MLILVSAVVLMVTSVELFTAVDSAAKWLIIPVVLAIVLMFWQLPIRQFAGLVTLLNGISLVNRFFIAAVLTAVYAFSLYFAYTKGAMWIRSNWDVPQIVAYASVTFFGLLALPALWVLYKPAGLPGDAKDVARAFSGVMKLALTFFAVWFAFEYYQVVIEFFMTYPEKLPDGVESKWGGHFPLFLAIAVASIASIVIANKIGHPDSVWVSKMFIGFMFIGTLTYLSFTELADLIAWETDGDKREARALAFALAGVPIVALFGWAFNLLGYFKKMLIGYEVVLAVLFVAWIWEVPYQIHDKKTGEVIAYATPESKIVHHEGHSQLTGEAFKRVDDPTTFARVTEGGSLKERFSGLLGGLVSSGKNVLGEISRRAHLRRSDLFSRFDPWECKQFFITGQSASFDFEIEFQGTAQFDLLIPRRGYEAVRAFHHGEKLTYDMLRSGGFIIRARESKLAFTIHIVDGSAAVTPLSEEEYQRHF
ncbi:MAG: hypothetical protein COU08_00815 [Candidatus Harrisonbacteria bacterium CG10_big_fil_rev_8_21_14_0_10_42_17]|uniref:Uncharacterized protein n=1 Tax=Candidatus Harrisonbacteria bacterium CG10_big_fil_rev_8_21_14_0_10_42_17 TaxID=1974584 RepID=A0A2M6WIU5_9BACT|nr:MAG: hypothetical protein COU08_00815 [Candidatus Harrisonbacteria bacterium CG10_big_fil_rev_8_21_14_0_10_42_17]